MLTELDFQGLMVSKLMEYVTGNTAHSTAGQAAIQYLKESSSTRFALFLCLSTDSRWLCKKCSNTVQITLGTETFQGLTVLSLGSRSA